MDRETHARQILRADVRTRGAHAAAMYHEDAMVNIGTAVSAMLTFAASEPTHSERVEYEERILSLEMEAKRKASPIVRDDHCGWQIEHNPPPIPCRDFDWTATHPDFNGPKDSRQVWGRTINDVVAAIDDWLEEYNNG